MNVEVLFPLVLPFLFGLLVGLFVKHVIKLAVFILLFIAISAVAGVATLTLPQLWERASRSLPAFASWAQGIIGTLPYSICAFAVGLAIGLWKG